MKPALALVVMAGLSQIGAAQSVVGKAEGFATGVTGGGDATPDHPETIEELTKLLTDTRPRVIVLSKEFDYTDSEGDETGTVCHNWGDGDGVQKIIADNGDCGNTPSSQATWPKAPRTPIDLGSDKTILGVGAKAAIKGKGLRIRGGAKNVIIQNIAVTDLNPEYVWGGDAISFDEAELVWVDHVTTARTGRQHYCFGYSPSKTITLSNNFVNGESPFSTGGDGYHYWTFEMVGEDDQITMQNNYIYRTAGRSPALSENTLHAVNKVWEDNNGHALEGGSERARGIFEGNVFINVRQMVAEYAGKLFSTPGVSSADECQLAFGRACEVNLLQDSKSGNWDKYTDTSFFSEYSEYEIAPAVSAEEAKKFVPANAGAGKIDTAVSPMAGSNDSVTTPTEKDTSIPKPAATNEAVEPNTVRSEEIMSSRIQEQTSQPTETPKNVKGSCKPKARM
ncbi:pectin lyase f [Fusarium sporotrichioides]|uniref:pectin lyase n=1 Tax=Fusarium sporotrichioides TaxID=5514 RepID=A0A395RNQ9_FUSSP|nr:pectin lyase f [Fusarium sporotrichioides]